jgi:hypothetical protein
MPQFRRGDIVEYHAEPDNPRYACVNGSLAIVTQDSVGELVWIKWVLRTSLGPDEIKPGELRNYHTNVLRKVDSEPALLDD